MMSKKGLHPNGGKTRNKMRKKYVIKCFTKSTYYCGENYGWSYESYLANYFDTIEDAENFIKLQDGKFLIEVVYIA